MQICVKLHATTTLPPGRNSVVRGIGGWVGPRNGPDVLEYKKVSLHRRDSNPPPSPPTVKLVA